MNIQKANTVLHTMGTVVTLLLRNEASVAIVIHDHSWQPPEDQLGPYAVWSEGTMHMLPKLEKLAWDLTQSSAIESMPKAHEIGKPAMYSSIKRDGDITVACAGPRWDKAQQICAMIMAAIKYELNKPYADSLEQLKTTTHHAA